MSDLRFIAIPTIYPYLYNFIKKYILKIEKFKFYNNYFINIKTY